MLKELIESFEDTIKFNDFFEYLGFVDAKNEILSSPGRIIFLLGEPGSGKSYLLSYLKYENPDKYLLIESPFSKVDLKNLDKDKTILVDEAQLLSLKTLEYLRILSDKGHKLVLGMHTQIGNKVASLPHFSSRYIDKVYIRGLTFSEFQKYVMNKFIQYQKQYLINQRILKKIYKYSKGNFRMAKKIIYIGLNLLDYSISHNLSYRTFDDCILDMSLLAIGVLK
jgi:hypothetical protein